MLIQIYLTFAPKGSIDNMSALLQMMAWRQVSNQWWLSLKTTCMHHPVSFYQQGSTGIRIWLTHWGRVTHICVSRLTITGLDNGLSPGRRQAIIWTNAGILLIGPLGTNFSENLIEILTFSFTKMRLKMSSAKWRQFCLGLNVLSNYIPSFQWNCCYSSMP